MAKKRRPTSLETQLTMLGVALSDPRLPENQSRLREVLLEGNALVAARAATSIAERRLNGFEPALEQGYQRFLDDPVKTDPGCRAKFAMLDALDRLESNNAAIFLTASRYEQWEPAFGDPVDTAAGVRARAVAGLARLGHADVPLVAARLLADTQAVVRRAAAEALAYHGERASAGLVWFKLHLGDEDDLVTLACASALLSLAPEEGLRTMRDILFGTELAKREIAALALGESRHDAALDLLFEYVDEITTPRERTLAFGGLGLSRSERARAFLLDRTTRGAATEAKAAVTALGTYAHEPGLVDRVRKAVENNERVNLRADFARAFGGSGQ